MKREFLGEFEELVLTIVATLAPDSAYGYTVMNAIEDHTGRQVTLSAVHATLYRLEDKGLLESKLAAGNNEKGGRSRRVFHLNHAGRATLRKLIKVRQSMWDLIGDL